MSITVIKTSYEMGCFECGTKVKYGLTRDGSSIFRIVCKKCMKDYVQGLSYYLSTGNYGEIVKSEDSESEES